MHGLGLLWRAEVGEYGEEVTMGAYVIAGDPAIGEGGEEAVRDVVGECATIAREGCRAAGIIVKDIGQERTRYARCFIGRVATRVLE